MGKASSKQGRKRDSVIQNELKKHQMHLSNQHKVLFVGSEVSGKKTIFKQFENIYDASYSENKTLNMNEIGIGQLEFKIGQSKLKLIHPNTSKTNWRKYIEYFDDIDAIIFVASLSCYDLKLNNNGLDLLVYGYINNICNVYNVPDCLTDLIIKFCDIEMQNAMTQQLNLFNDICNHHIFKEISIILLLNKIDIFKEKIIHRKISLTKCPSFANYDGTLNELVEPIQYVRNAFLSLNNQHNDRNIFCHETCGIDRDMLQKLSCDLQHIHLEHSMKYAGLIYK